MAAPILTDAQVRAAVELQRASSEAALESARREIPGLLARPYERFGPGSVTTNVEVAQGQLSGVVMEAMSLAAYAARVSNDPVAFASWVGVARDAAEEKARVARDVGLPVPPQGRVVKDRRPVDGISCAVRLMATVLVAADAPWWLKSWSHEEALASVRSLPSDPDHVQGADLLHGLRSLVLRDRALSAALVAERERHPLPPALRSEQRLLDWDLGVTRCVAALLVGDSPGLLRAFRAENAAYARVGSSRLAIPSWMCRTGPYFREFAVDFAALCVAKVSGPLLHEVAPPQVPVRILQG